MYKVTKRDNKIAEFDISKIAVAITKAGHVCARHTGRDACFVLFRGRWTITFSPSGRYRFR